MTITTDVATFLGAEPDPLIKAGRYQVVPADDDKGKTKAHTRITNFAKKLEDEYGLTKWKLRSVLLGAAQRSDILVAALAANDDTKELDKLADAAIEAAKGNVKRETGSALHKLCERADAGEILDLPEPWRTDVAAYLRCLDELNAVIEYIEEVVVCPKLNLAGRLDRIIGIDDTSYIMDIKTGKDLSFSWNAIAIQLALYAGAATIYDPVKKTHRPMPKVDQGKALVLHLQSGENACTPYWVNLEAGRAGIAMVRDLMAWRKNVKNVATTAANPHFPANEDTREYITQRCMYVMEHGHGQELARRWPDDVPTLKSFADHSEQQLNQILKVCEVIEGLHGMSFFETPDERGLNLF